MFNIFNGFALPVDVDMIADYSDAEYMRQDEEPMDTLDLGFLEDDFGDN